MTKKAAKAQAQNQATEGTAEPAKKSNHVQRILEERKKDAKIDPLLESQFSAGRLYAAIASRPGQSGRGDGYILEGKELEVSGPGLLPMRSLGSPGFSSTLGKSRQGSRSTRTVHEHIVTCSIFFENDCMVCMLYVEQGNLWFCIALCLPPSRNELCCSE